MTRTAPSSCTLRHGFDARAERQENTAELVTNSFEKAAPAARPPKAKGCGWIRFLAVLKEGLCPLFANIVNAT